MVGASTADAVDQQRTTSRAVMVLRGGGQHACRGAAPGSACASRAPLVAFPGARWCHSAGLVPWRPMATAPRSLLVQRAAQRAREAPVELERQQRARAMRRHEHGAL